MKTQLKKFEKLLTEFDINYKKNFDHYTGTVEITIDDQKGNLHMTDLFGFCFDTYAIFLFNEQTGEYISAGGHYI